MNVELKIAAMAMQGLLASGAHHFKTEDDIARESIGYAEALLKLRYEKANSKIRAAMDAEIDSWDLPEHSA